MHSEARIRSNFNRVFNSKAVNVLCSSGAEPLLSLRGYALCLRLDILRHDLKLELGLTDAELDEVYNKVIRDDELYGAERSPKFYSETLLSELEHTRRGGKADLTDDALERLNRNLADHFTTVIKQPWLREWLAKPMVVGRPDVPLMHQAMKQLQLTPVTVDIASRKFELKKQPIQEMPSIIVEHDWAALVQAESGGEWRPPFNWQAFEFKISGLHLIAIVYDTTENNDFIMSVCIRDPAKNWHYPYEMIGIMPDSWKFLTTTGSVSPFRSLYDLLHRQIRACCIMMDAEVAVREPIRAPHKPSDPKRDRVPLPPMTYHVLKLAKHYRAAPRDPLEANADYEKRTSPRLHFRRPHWRRMPDSVEMKYITNYTDKKIPDVSFIVVCADDNENTIRSSYPIRRMAQSHAETIDHNRQPTVVFRTRISWMLVGDEKLGIVVKDYSI